MPLCSECQAYAIDAIFYFDRFLLRDIRAVSSAIAVNKKPGEICHSPGFRFSILISGLNGIIPTQSSPAAFRRRHSRHG